MKNFTIGVDVGGTSIKLGLVDGSGKVRARSRLATIDFARNKKKLIKALVSAIEDLLNQKRLTRKDVAGIGIGLPGLIDHPAGMVKFLPNIPGWRNVPLKRLMEQRLRIPTFLENDVNLIVLAEWKFGAGKGCKNLLCMTLGTGVGGGLIFNNQLYRGEGFVAGEFGHMPLNEKGPDCNCGGFGCFEQYVGNRQLMAKAAKIFKKKDITPPEIRQLADHGNARAKELWEEMATHIGNALVGVVNLLNPRVIIIGGGLSNHFKYLQPTIMRIIKSRGMQVQRSMVKIVRAKLGDDAGIIGAQVLVKESK